MVALPFLVLLLFLQMSGGASALRHRLKLEDLDNNTREEILYSAQDTQEIVSALEAIKRSTTVWSGPVLTSIHDQIDAIVEQAGSHPKDKSPQQTVDKTSVLEKRAATKKLQDATKVSRHLLRGVGDLQKAYSRTPPNHQQATRGILSIISAATVAIPPPTGLFIAGIVELARFIVGQFNSDAKTDPSIGKIVAKAVAEGLNTYKKADKDEQRYVCKKNLRLAFAVLKPYFDEKQQPIPKPQRDRAALDLRLTQIVDSVDKFLWSLESYIKKAPWPPKALKFDAVWAELVKTDTPRDSGSGFMGGVLLMNGFEGDMAAEVGRFENRLRRACALVPEDKPRGWGEPKGTTYWRDGGCYKSVPVYVGMSEQPPLEYGCIWGSIVCSAACKMASGIRVLPDPQGGAIQCSWKDVPLLVDAYYELQISKLLLLHYAVQVFMAPATDVDSPSATIALMYKEHVCNTLQGMTEFREHLESASKAEADSIDKFVAQMKQDGPEWMNSLMFANRVKGEAMMYLGYPRVFQHLAAHALELAVNSEDLQELSASGESSCRSDGAWA